MPFLSPNEQCQSTEWKECLLYVFRNKTANQPCIIKGLSSPLPHTWWMVSSRHYSHTQHMHYRPGIATLTVCTLQRHLKPIIAVLHLHLHYTFLSIPKLGDDRCSQMRLQDLQTQVRSHPALEHKNRNTEE